MTAPLEIDCCFPGGNIIVDGTDGDRVDIRPDLRDTEGFWFYWCFRVRGGYGRTVTFRFPEDNLLTEAGPAVSGDGGKTWAWTETMMPDEQGFRYTFPDSYHEIRFSMGMPYTRENLEPFLARNRGARLREELLCRSRKGRSVELLRLGRTDGGGRFRIMVTARHHCCEMMASYVLEGVCSSVLSEGDDFELIAVPFVDKDGVEDGDQGKNRRPYDHNRDYVGESIYPEVAAIRRLPARFSGKIDAFLDIHCPWIRMNETDGNIYLVGSKSRSMRECERDFGKLLERTVRGLLPYYEASTLEYGSHWNTGTGDPSLMSSSAWMHDAVPDIALSASMEVPYAFAGGVAVTQESARSFGADVGRALMEFVRTRR